MIRLILIVIVFFLAIISGGSIALHHFFGWKGLIALPFLMLALIWVAKMVIGKLIKRFALGLFSMKSRALRGAAMKVHSISPVTKPLPAESEADNEKAEEDSDDESKTEDAAKEADSDEPEKPRHYYAVDLTITPQASDAIWEPGELILATERVTSLEDLEAKEAGRAHEVQIWNGTAFGPDDPGKYPGEQRLNVIFEVEPGKTRTWVHYYNEPIGELALPEWRASLAPA